MIGVRTPRILWIMASISVNLLVTTCCSEVLGEERRSELLMGKGVAPVPDHMCRAWLMIEIGGDDWRIVVVINGRVV